MNDIKENPKLHWNWKTINRRHNLPKDFIKDFIKRSLDTK